MKEIFPNTININTIKCYQIKDGFSCTKSRIKCQNFGEWCRDLPKTLKELSIQSISDNWEDNPLLDEICSPEDRCILLNILPTNLPLCITVPIINDNFYWKKSALERWPHLMPTNVTECDMFTFPSKAIEKKSFDCDDENISDTSLYTENSSEKTGVFTETKSWKQYYLENHIKEYLEKLQPEEYDPEEMKKICDICGPFVKSLQIEELRRADKDGCRIPIGSVLSGLPKLQELSICFKEKYIGFENFNWSVIHPSARDIKNLAKGLEKTKLLTVRILNSGLERNECIPILNSLRKYDNLNILDFSYCSLGNEGTISLCRFIREMSVKELSLIDNNIGDEGAEAIAFVLHNHECTLRYLNVRMNPIGSRSGNLILESVLFNRNLKILDLSACNIGFQEAIGKVLRKSSSLQELYLSNNPIGNEVGNVILNCLNFNKTLRKIDLRMCNIHSELQHKINEKIKGVAESSILKFLEEDESEPEFSDKCRKHFEGSFEE
ncbi:dynein regulatory complex subunit 5-like [Coccinella septempunctata]|uniref:dynein regulatory complex subunit 5-like n=1 Tax=Coccinella septempunctata TaxID=41139 RepID=UPI001D068165|nr:dynein regulatory complex subunit 5-like [Coccinella septempunctata]